MLYFWLVTKKLLTMKNLCTCMMQNSCFPYDEYDDGFDLEAIVPADCKAEFRVETRTIYIF